MATWLTANITRLETLIAETTDPSVIERMGEGTTAAVIENRMTDDYYNDATEFIEKMPFWVIRESQPTRLNLRDSSGMQGRAAFEIAYFEWANQYLSVPNLQVRNRLSKRYFLEFVEGVMLSVSERQNRGDTVQLALIELIEPAQRTHPTDRDKDNPHTDFWLMRWRFHVGDLNG